MGLAVIATSLRDARIGLTGAGEITLDNGKDIPLADIGSPKAKGKKKIGDGTCILCGERPAQDGTDVCWLCEQEDVGTALIHDMPSEEVP